MLLVGIAAPVSPSRQVLGNESRALLHEVLHSGAVTSTLAVPTSGGEVDRGTHHLEAAPSAHR